MPITQIIIMAVALAMDAFAVSVAAGVGRDCIRFRTAFRLAWHFGMFQALMPIVGWLGGATVSGYMAAWDHWIAFVLLAAIGGKMLAGGIMGEAPVEAKKDITRGTRLVMLSIATSIDALAVGFSLSVLKVSIWFPAAVIGLTAAGFTVLGLHLGCRLGNSAKLGRFADMFGGIVLIGIGNNILREHSVFW